MPSSEKIILITGCSSGFGLLTAARLSTHRDYVVYATMRNLSKKHDLLAEVSRRKGTVHILPLDVTQQATIDAAVATIHAQEKRIDVVINNAGYGLGGFFEDVTEQEMRDQLETNFFGVQRVIRAVLPIMRAQKQGKIINISSVSGRMSFPILSAYGASKWAVEGWSESLRLELLPFGIKVLLVEPGSFQTKIFNENARIACNAHNPASCYYPYSQYLIEKRTTSLEKVRSNPDVVARAVEKLVAARHPRFRTVVGYDARLMLYAKLLLPHAVYERILNFFAMRKKKQ